MPTLHGPNYRGAIATRLRKVKADSPRKWGVMTPDQMMWHLAEAIQQYLSEIDVGDMKPPCPMPKALMRFGVISLPWPKGLPTMSPIKAVGLYDLEEQRSRCLKLIDDFSARPIDGPWPLHPLLGKLTGEQCSRLQAKHFNHHLTQFGV